MESDNESTNSEPSRLDSEKKLQVRQEEREKIRKEISTMSFEDLHKLKEKIGSKQYNETVFGNSHRPSETNYKRANKNRPREMSSKIRSTAKQQTVQFKSVPPRDPRFDPLCGTFEEKSFKSNYKFIKDLRKDERKELQKELDNTEDPQRQKQIKLLIQRMDNQIREQEKREKHQTEQREERKEIKDKLKKGQKPIFKKKSEKKIENLIHQYEELKKTNKLQKHIEKRSKKLAVKERRKQPNDVFE